MDVLSMLMSHRMAKRLILFIMKISTDQLVICQSHSLRLFNSIVVELNNALKENGCKELVSYYRKELDEICKHLESIGYKG